MEREYGTKHNCANKSNSVIEPTIAMSNTQAYFCYELQSPTLQMGVEAVECKPSWFKKQKKNPNSFADALQFKSY